MRICLLLLLLPLIISAPAFAGHDSAETPPGQQEQTDSLTVERPWVVRDPRVDILMEAHRKSIIERGGIPGFRVQIYMDSGNQARLRTQRVRAEFEEKFPGIRAHVVWDEPSFKLRVGDFRTRLDARRFLERVSREYPAAYIVIDNIAFPLLEE